ncbi:hypothetical protein [Nocardia sp. NPDC051570]|uniref:hypothetical protein n=1 Tax=Nocardia sp. NPDC051570 TaxID=3364324 RepID=UPI0037AD6C5A
MHLPRCWFGVDVIATLLREEIFIHSAGGQRVARPLRRVASRLGFDRQGEDLFTAVVRDALAGPAVDRVRAEGGLECHTHWIKAPDDTSVGLIVWLAAAPVQIRPVYNSWILDLHKVATRSGGDNLGLIGSDRLPGEERPIRDLLRHTNPEDAGEFLSLYYGARTGKEGAYTEAFWSVRPGDDWVHFWSSTNLVGSADSGRATVYGLTAQLRDRELDTRLGTLVRYTNATLLMVDAQNKVTVTATGELAPALEDEQLLEQVLAQIDTDRVLAATSDSVVEQTIAIEGDQFRAAAFSVTNARKHIDGPVAILLVPARTD